MRKEKEEAPEEGGKSGTEEKEERGLRRAVQKDSAPWRPSDVAQRAKREKREEKRRGKKERREEKESAMRGFAGFALSLCFVTLVLASLSRSVSAIACANGTPDEKNATCLCTNAEPKAGEQGWTGANCDYPLYGIELSPDKPVTDWCADQGCNNITRGEKKCFLAYTPWKPIRWEDPNDPGRWKYLAFFLERTSPSGDPDLYGLFTNDVNTRRPSKSHINYDFRETSSVNSKSTLVVEKDDVGRDKDYNMTFVCIDTWSSQNATFSLTAYASECPAGYDNRGVLNVCSSPMNATAEDKRYTKCTAGVCDCKPEYSTPLEEDGTPIDVYPELGFDKCAAQVLPLNDFQKKNDMQESMLVTNQTVQLDSWNFYPINISNSTWETIVTVECDNCGNTDDGPYKYMSSYPILTMKYGAPPGMKWKDGAYEYDLRSYSNTGDEQLSIRKDNKKYREGTWFVGVHSSYSSTGPISYTLQIDRNSCPNGCSGRGKSCTIDANDTRTCECEKGYFKDDCSADATPLAYGEAFEDKIEDSYYEYFQLPTISAVQASRNIDIKLRASYTGYDCPAHWLSCHPSLLVKKGGGSEYPQMQAYTFKQDLLQENATSEILICSSQLVDGVWRGAIYNPRKWMPINYTVEVVKESHCINNCSNRGDCVDGICQCHHHYGGGDCSVSTSCMPGDRKSNQRTNGVCWEECTCETRGDVTTCGYDNTCVSFECNPPLRWTGVGDECVADECEHDHLFVSDQENYSCLKRCKCDGGKACKLDDECDPGTVTCLAPFRKDPNTGECMLEGCAEGTVQLNMLNPVENGKCFMDCKCKNSAENAKERCVYDGAGACGHIACDAGYMLVESTAKDPTNVKESGGKCVADKKMKNHTAVAVTVSFVMLIMGVVIGGGLMFFFEKKFQKKVRFAGYSNFGEELG